MLIAWQQLMQSDDDIESESVVEGTKAFTAR